MISPSFIFLPLLFLLVEGSYDFTKDASFDSPPSASPPYSEETEKKANDFGKLMALEKTKASTEELEKDVVNENPAIVEDDSTDLARKDNLEVEIIREEFDKMSIQQSAVSCRADILFVLDSTGSMRQLYNSIKEYVVKVVEALSISDNQNRVGLILFGGPGRQRTKIKLGQFKDQQKLAKFIKKLPFLSGITATGSALNYTRSVLENRRKDVRTNVIVLTDGFSYDLIGGAAKKVHDLANVKVFSVSVGDSFVQEVLELIAGSKTRVLQGASSYSKLIKMINDCETSSKSSAMNSPTAKPIVSRKNIEGLHVLANPNVNQNTNELPEAETQLVEDDFDNIDYEKKSLELSKEKNSLVKVVEESSENTAYEGRPNEQTTILSEKSSNVKEFTNRRLDEPDYDCERDVVFLFDASGSLQTGFTKQLELANSLIDKFVLGPHAVQVAAVKYAGKNKSKVLLNLTDAFDHTTLKKKIRRTRFMGGTTFTNEALIMAANLLKSEEARPNKAIPTVIVFTDGFSGEDPLPGSQLLHSMGVQVFAVGIDDNAGSVNQKELEIISGDESRIFLTSTFSTFLSHMDMLKKECLAKQQRT